MDTREFFHSILPSRGYYCLAQPIKDKKSFHHDFFSTQEALAAAALAIDATGKTVYHACASFTTFENRKQDNAAYMRSFWVDADVDPENALKYPSIKAAIEDVGRVCKALALPLPLMVKSGGGLHAYWTLLDDVDAQQWSATARLFKEALTVLGFKQDNTRTADAASVLRPVGTFWRKRAAREVVAISPGVPISFAHFAARFGGLDSAMPRPDHFAGTSNDDLGTPPEYPPSSAPAILPHCATLAYVAGQLGNVTEPLWRAMLGVVKYTLEGESQCHEWSSGHPEYNESETQQKIDNWAKGPTTCAHFRGTNDNQCTGCPQQVTSPIQLGYVAPEEAAAVVYATPDAMTTVAVEGPWTPHGFPPNYRWDGKHLSVYTRGPDGVGLYNRFSDSLFWPVARMKDQDGEWGILMEREIRPGETERFMLPAGAIGSQEFVRTHSAHEIFFGGHAKAIKMAQDYLSSYLLSLRKARVEQHTYETMGWAKNFTEFVLGNRCITESDESVIIAGEKIRDAGWDKEFACKGSAERWIDLVDTVFNRPGAEAYQFEIVCAFAAPLIELAEIKNWHGIPVALVGPTGLGKTTTCQVACSIYGDPEFFKLNAGDQGTTLQSMISRTGAAKNLPLIYDEITERGFQDVISLAYSLSTGRPKDRNSRDGRIVNSGLRWATLGTMTSNESPSDVIALHDKASTVEAAQVRVFEIGLPLDYARSLWPDINARDVIETQLLVEQYGHVGRRWLHYVIKNRNKLRDHMRAMRIKFNPNTIEETRERYYRDLVSLILVTLTHLNSQGIVKFNVDAVRRWAAANIKTLRARRHNLVVTPEAYIAAYIASLTRRTINTRFFGDGRLADKKEAADIPFETPVARQAREDRVCIATVRSMSDWSKEHKLAPDYLLEQMTKRGYIVYRPDKHGTPQRTWQGRLTKGTNIGSTNEWLVEFDYNLIYGPLAAATSNVVNLVPSPGIV